MSGLECKDIDVKRFLYYEQIPTHHPIKDFMASLPEWDGTDRVTMLAYQGGGNGYSETQPSILQAFSGRRGFL